MTLHKISLQTKRPVDFYEITKEVQEIITASSVKDGICHVFVPHTTAAVTINERADPDVARDMITSLDTLIPGNYNYHHAEGNSPGHIKASLIGSSQTVFIENGRLLLGTWQGIFFCEFDGPRTRKVFIKIIPEKETGQPNEE